MISVTAGESFEVTFDYGETGLVDSSSIGVQILDEDLTVVTARVTTGIVEVDASGIYVATLLAPTTAGDYYARADIDSAEPFIDEPVLVLAASAETTGTYASAADVAARLCRELTEAEETSVEFLLMAAYEVINAATGQPDPDPEPTILRIVSVELVTRAMSNPQSLASRSETLGAYSHSATFRKELSSDLMLTDAEELLVRRAVLGQLSGTGQQQSLGSDCCVICALSHALCVCGCDS